MCDQFLAKTGSMDRIRKENTAIFSLLALTAVATLGGLALQIKSTYLDLTKVGVVHIEIPSINTLKTLKNTLKIAPINQEEEFEFVSQIEQKKKIAKNEKLIAPKAFWVNNNTKTKTAKNNSLDRIVVSKSTPTKLNEDERELDDLLIYSIHQELKQSFQYALRDGFENGLNKVAKETHRKNNPNSNVHSLYQVHAIDSIPDVERGVSTHKKVINRVNNEYSKLSTQVKIKDNPIKVVNKFIQTKSQEIPKKLIITAPTDELKLTKRKLIIENARELKSLQKSKTNTDYVLTQKSSRIKSQISSSKNVKEPEINHNKLNGLLTQFNAIKPSEDTKSKNQEKHGLDTHTHTLRDIKDDTNIQISDNTNGLPIGVGYSLNTQTPVIDETDVTRDNIIQKANNQVQPLKSELARESTNKITDDKTTKIKNTQEPAGVFSTAQLYDWVQKNKNQSNNVAQNQPIQNSARSTPSIPNQVNYLPAQETQVKDRDDGDSKNNQNANKVNDGLNAMSTITESVKGCDSVNGGVDAFLHYSKIEQFGICKKPLSDEGRRKGSQSRWWEVKKSIDTEDYWTTIAFFSPQSPENVELISNNSIQFLSVLAKTQISKSSAIVFGKINKNQNVKLSGRGDLPLYFNEIDEPEKNTKHFVFLNVEPGAALLHIYGHSGQSMGSIPLIAKEQRATYMNVVDAKQKTLSGYVWSAASSSPLAQISLSVEIVGQHGKKAITNSKGYFEIPDVYQYSDYPVYVDLVRDDYNYRHRYRLDNLETSWSNKDFFYFDLSQVNQWLTQLDGGISPSSSIIVGAIHAPAQLKMKLKSIVSKTELKPEIYEINETGQLSPFSKSTQSKLKRFVIVQVPEGVSQIVLDQDTGKRYWSNSVISQPGVINVVEN